MKPLSEQLAEMSATAKEVEDTVAQARKAGRDKVDAMVAEARANADTLATQVDQDVGAAQSAVVDGWRGLQTTVRADVDRVKADIDAAKYEREADRAQASAEAAERRAEQAIMVATMAIGNAKVMTLEAIAARATADAY